MDHFLIESKVLGLSLTYYKCYIDAVTMTIESAHILRVDSYDCDCILYIFILFLIHETMAVTLA